MTMDSKEVLTDDNKKKEIVMLRLYNGDMIIGERVWNEPLSCNFNLDYILENPRAIAIMPTMSGSVKIAMGSVCEPFRVERLKKQISINSAQVMFALSEDEIDKELVNGYKSEISGIKIATAADTAAINSTKGAATPGEFIL